MSEDRIGVIRDGYHEQLLEVTEACRDDGLIFAEQMGALCRAFRFVRQGMRPGLDGEEIERPSPSLARTPAGRIMEMVMGYANEELRPGQTLRAKRIEDGSADRGSFSIESGPLPSPPKGMRVRKGPPVHELLNLPPDKFIRVKAGEMKLSSLRIRLSQVKKKAKEQGKELRLVCWEDQDGTLVVRHA